MSSASLTWPNADGAAETAPGARCPARALLHERVRRAPQVIDRVLADPSFIDFACGERVVTTGIGASEGPARMLASLLVSELDISAAFAPISSFVAGRPKGDRLVLFSQGLSPNARIALGEADSYPRRVLVTGRPASDDAVAAFARAGGDVVSVGPPREDGLLARVSAPLAASLISILLVRRALEQRGVATPSWASSLAQLPHVAASAPSRVEGLLSPSKSHVLKRPVLFVGAADVLERSHGAVNRWLEACAGPAPRQSDILGFAHGPLQEVWDREIVVIGLERALPTDARLFDRLESVLVPGRHALIRLRATLPGPVAAVEHELLINELILSALLHRPRDTSSWPGSGVDAPLYGLSSMSDD